MTSFLAKYPEESSRRDPGWADWFGPSRGDPVVTNPYSAYPRESLALPEIYKGSNLYLTNIMLSIISEEELVPTRILLPLRQQEDTTIMWDEFKFNQTLLGPVPEEGISRLVTQQVSEHRDHLTRFGLAFMIEHGFMKTAKGQMTYKANLEQIRDAVLQSLYIGVIDTLLRCKSNSQLFQQCYGKSLTALSARKRLEMECESFAEIQKSDHGWEMLNSRAQRNLKVSCNLKPDAWVVDDGVKKYIASRRESWAYFLHGDRGENLRLENQGSGDPKSLDIASGCLIFETKLFNIPTENDPVNITSRKRSIGEYMVSFPHLDYNSCGKYTTSMRDIMVYDEDRDGFGKLSIKDGIDSCMRFTKEGDLDSHGFYPTGADPKGKSQHTDTDGDDMFFTPKHPYGVEYFSQMDIEHMPNEAVRDWICSVAGQFDPRTRSELVTNLEALANLLEKLDGMPNQANGDTKKYFDYVNRAYTTHQTDAKFAKKFDETSGMLKLDEILEPLMANKTTGVKEPNSILVDPSFIPYGFGSYAGICELATYPAHKIALSDDAKKAKHAIDIIKQKLDAVSYGNMFMDAASVPFYITEKSVAAAVFCNLIHERLPPVVITGVRTNLKLGGAAEAMDVEDRTAYYDAFVRCMMLENNVDDDDSKAKALALSKKVSGVLLSMCDNIGELYRRRLLSILQQKEKDKYIDDSATEKVVIIEELYALFMQRLDGHTWFSICTALDDFDSNSTYTVKNLPECFDKSLVNHKQLTNEALAKLSEYNRKTVVTQLTCSEKLKRYFDANATLIKATTDPDEFTKMLSYESEEEKTGKGKMAQLGAGEPIGVERNEGGVFGLKRKRDIGANAPDPKSVSVRAWWQDDKEVSGRIAEVRNLYSSCMERTFGVAFLGNSVHKTTLDRFISTGCVVPFNVIYARPYQTYNVSTGICMKAGPTTGETLVGHADFQLADNIVQKLHYGNFTFYSKSVVYRQQQVYLANNMFSTGYMGGSGCEFFTSRIHYETYLEQGNGDMRQKSIFALLTSYSSKLYVNPINITGRHSGNLHTLNNELNDHYASANFYRKVWGWADSSEDAPGRCSFDADEDGDSNTVCFQGHQTLYNPGNGGMFDITIKNTGHWGPNVYAGVGKVRNGHQKVVESVNYPNLYGGGGNLSGMLK